jgi:uncharacterized protein (TIGR00106 family)
MLFSVSMFPIGSDDSILGPVAEVVEEIDRAGLHYQVTAMDTVIEGEWEHVVPALRRAQQRLRQHNERVFMRLEVDDHAGSQDRMLKSVTDVEQRVRRD